MINADDGKILRDVLWMNDLIGDSESVPDHMFLMGDFALWNTISNHVNQGRFDISTKISALSLIERGAKSGFIQCLANGDLSFPDDVIHVALMAEKLDRLYKRSKK